jgi:two-component system sensor histidine kinase BaeS
MHLGFPLVVVLVASVLLTRFWRTLDTRLAASAAGLDDALAELRDDLSMAIDRRLQPRRPVDLRRLLDEMPHDCEALLRGSGIALAIDSSLAIALPALGRGDELRQLLAHVAAIAVHAMPRGGVLKARLFAEERHARVEFTDVGAISPEPLLAALYLHGARQVLSGPLARGGLAAGVASCRRIVAAHGGCIDVRPSSDSAAPAVSVRLPLLHAERPERGPVAPSR